AGHDRVEGPPGSGDGVVTAVGDRRIDRTLGRIGLLLLLLALTDLGLEDAQGTAGATREFGELATTEEQDDDPQDDEDLGCAEAGHVRLLVRGWFHRTRPTQPGP